MLSEHKCIYLAGYSGHSYVILETVQRLKLHVNGYLDNTEKVTNPYNLNYLGTESSESFQGWSEESAFILAIGNNEIRTRIGQLVRHKEKVCLTLIDPYSHVSLTAQIGSGTFVSIGAVINAKAKIGEDVIINTSSIVEHECVIGSGVHIAPGATVLGGASIGKNSFIGANAVIKQGIQIGDNVTVGAGSVVVDNIPAGIKIVGNPAKRILK